MNALPRAIQGLILFSTLLGVFFLWQAYPLIFPVVPYVFYALLLGWVLFVFDSILTFVRTRVSFYLGVVLAAIALTETLIQPEHYSLIQSGNVSAAIIIVLGSVSQALLIVLTIFYLVTSRKKNPWAWPGDELPDSDIAPTEQHVAVMGPTLTNIAPVEHVRYHDVLHVLVSFVDGI